MTYTESAKRKVTFKDDGHTFNPCFPDDVDFKSDTNLVESLELLEKNRDPRIMWDDMRGLQTSCLWYSDMRYEKLK